MKTRLFNMLSHKGILLSLMMVFFCLFICVGHVEALNVNYYSSFQSKGTSGQGYVYHSQSQGDANAQYSKAGVAPTVINAGKAGIFGATTQTYYAWAFPARAYNFAGWSVTNVNNEYGKTGAADIMNVTGAETRKAGVAQATWTSLPSYDITYITPENGSYSVQYSYTDNNSGNTGLQAYNPLYNMTGASANQVVTSYERDLITLRVVGGTFLGWYESNAAGDEITLLSEESEYTYKNNTTGHKVDANVYIKAKFKAPSLYKASVTIDGETTNYTTLADALTAANASSANPTITLLDNVLDLTTSQSITKSMTIDLNDYSITGNVTKLININGTGITVTIRDHGENGKGAISMIGSANGDLYGVCVTKGTLVLESGTIHGENTAERASNGNARAMGVYVTNPYTFNMTGGKVEAVSDQYAYGVWNHATSATSHAKTNISGGTIEATSTSNVRGVLNYGDLVMDDGEVIANTTSGTGAVGIFAGESKNSVTTINGGTVTATAFTTNATGVRAETASCTININGGTILAKTLGTTTAYGIFHNAAATTNVSGGTITSNPKTTTGYGIYSKGGTINVTGGTIFGNATTETGVGIYANAGTVNVNGGVVRSAAPTKTSYALQQASTAVFNVTDGKFYSTSSGAAANATAANVANILVSGGFYNIRTNLDNYLVGEQKVWALTNGSEYDAGYRYTIANERPRGVSICKATSSNGNTNYAFFYSLESALVYAQENSGTAMNIVMLSDYTLPAGYYTIPSDVTLLIPWKLDQNKPAGSAVQRENNNELFITSTTALFRKLTFESGVHMTVEYGGKIEVGGIQNSYNNNGTGVPIRNYGQLQMEEGSDIILCNGSSLMAWGYITGQGTIDARRGSICYEMFQIYDFKGGSFMISGLATAKASKAFPVNQYFIQNIEVPVKFHPGAKELTCMAAIGISKDGVGIIGTYRDAKDKDAAMFLMDEMDDSDDTWVRKYYDAVNDRQVYEVNSAAQISSIDISFSTYGINSKDYILPLTNNMTIRLLDGTLDITQDVAFLPGTRLEIAKEATANIQAGMNMYMYDCADWGSYVSSGGGSAPAYSVKFSPSWSNGKNPRSVATKEALGSSSLNVKGTFEVNGSIYTSQSGANIFSTNDDAGTFKYNNPAPSVGTTKTVKMINGLSSSRPTFGETTFYSANLHNGAGIIPEFQPTEGTAAGMSLCYIDDRWVFLTIDGCFAYDQYNIYYAKPHDYVALYSEIEDENHLYYSQDQSRMFILMDDCQWWEVTPYDDIYYCADNDTYYYYDEDEETWLVKTLTVTWKNWNGTTVDTYENVRYGSTPKFLGTNPKRAMDTYYTYDFVGWLPAPAAITSDAVYVAQYEQNDRMYQITFKDKSGTTIETDYYAWGSMPVCEKEPSGVGTTLEWSPALATVSGTQIYQLRDKQVKAQYSVIFKNYNGAVLQSGSVNAGELPVYTEEPPTKPSLGEYVFTFKGWDKEIVPATEDIIYTATYTQSYAAHTIRFYAENGTTLLQEMQVTHGEMPIYTEVLPTKVHANPTGYYYELVWSPLVSAAIADQNYRATFVERVNTLRTVVEAGAHGTISVRNNTTSTDVATNETRFSEQYEYNTSLNISATADAGYHFERWSDGYTSNPRTITVTQSATLTAIFDIDRADMEQDIIDWSASEIVLNMFGFSITPASSWKINVNATDYTVSDCDAQRRLHIPTGDLTADADFTIIAKNGEVEEGRHTYKVAHVFDTRWTRGALANLTASSTLFVRSGKLTISANTTVGTIYVAPGAELEIAAGVTLNVAKLVLRTESHSTAVLTNNGTLNVTGQMYYTRIIYDPTQFFQFAIPFGTTATLDQIQLSGAKDIQYGKWVLREYRGDNRANQGAGDPANWQDVAKTDTIVARKGYEIFSNSKYYREFYFPVTYAESTTTAVTYHNGTEADKEKGWNFVCSPVTSVYGGRTTIENPVFLTFINKDNKTYTQKAMVSNDGIQPATPFYYQTAANGNLTFGLTFTVPAPAAVAARQVAAEEPVSIQWLQIALEEAATELSDETNFFLHPSRFTAGYEHGFDLSKMIGYAERPQLYSSMPACGMLAFNAIPDELVENALPLGVYVAHSGMHIFALNPTDYMERFQNVYLFDSALGITTDLLTDDYSYEAEVGTTENRFFLQVIFRAPSIATDLDDMQGATGEESSAIKIYHDGHIYILRDARVYDVTGRETRLF